MIITCPSCSARYKLDKAKVTGRGARITCPRCRHVFVVYPDGEGPADETTASTDASDLHETEIPNSAPRSAAALNFREVGIASWKVKVKIGLVYDFADIKTLRKYLLEGRVTPEDAISHDGREWTIIGDIPDLDAYFLAIYDRLLKARNEQLPTSTFDDDEAPTTIMGVASIGKNSGSTPQLNTGGGGDEAGDIQRAMAEAIQAESGGASEFNNPFNDPFAAMRNKQRSRIQQRRRSSERPRPTQKEKPKGKPPLGIIAAIIIFGTLGVFATQSGETDEGTSPTVGTTVAPVNARTITAQAPSGPSLRDQVIGSLEEVEASPIEDDFADDPVLTAVVPSDAEIRAQEQRSKNYMGLGTAGGVPTPTPQTDSDLRTGATTANDHYMLGESSARSGDWGGAAKAFGNAVGMAPENGSYRCRYGEALYYSGNGSEATGQLGGVTGSCGTANKILGHIYRELGDTAAANSYYQAYLASSPSDAAEIQATITRMTGG